MPNVFSNEELVVQLEGAGFDRETISSLIQQHGAEVLALVLKTITSGVSKDLVVEVLQLGGKIALELLSIWKSIDGPLFGVGPQEAQKVVEANQPVVNDLVQKYLPQLLDKVVPLLLDKGAPFITDLILKLLTKK
jgi:hypothetical protein